MDVDVEDTCQKHKDGEGKSKHSHAHRGTRNKVGLESATAPFSNEQERTADTHRQVDAREM
eukprot:scaffold86277_cov19-Tisochrysis_lutea.AAC.3